jgi:hypothetical protein
VKIYEINGRKVWLNKAPEGYIEPEKKAEPEKDPEPTAAPKAKARKTPANKSRKAGGNK